MGSQALKKSQNHPKNSQKGHFAPIFAQIIDIQFSILVLFIK
jgi:hypothetical protein